MYKMFECMNKYAVAHNANCVSISIYRYRNIDTAQTQYRHDIT